MQWPSWVFWRQNEQENSNLTEAVISKKDDAVPEAEHSKDTPIIPSPSVPWDKNLNRTDWSHYTTTQTITISLITTVTTLALVRLYKTHLRRIPTVDYLKPGFFRHRNIYGYVTRVGDGDNFHLYHTPGGRWLGWGWLPGRVVKKIPPKDLKGKTIHVRIAGVDAPELAHFGKPAQPYGQEAIDWLKGHVLHKFVRVYPFRGDQYSRVVCAVYKRKWVFFQSDVGLNMLKTGLATVYEAKSGSEFNNQEEKYRATEKWAKHKKIGMWQQPGLVGRLLGKKASSESPREFKTRMASQDKNEKPSSKPK